VRATLPRESGLGPATTPYRTVAPSFVISTGAKRSGEISVLTPLPGDVLSTERNGEMCGFSIGAS
jgi:hypothetical protein